MATLCNRQSVGVNAWARILRGTASIMSRSIINTVEAFAKGLCVGHVAASAEFPTRVVACCTILGARNMAVQC